MNHQYSRSGKLLSVCFDAWNRLRAAPAFPEESQIWPSIVTVGAALLTLLSWIWCCPWSYSIAVAFLLAVATAAAFAFLAAIAWEARRRAILIRNHLRIEDSALERSKQNIALVLTHIQDERAMALRRLQSHLTSSATGPAVPSDPTPAAPWGSQDCAIHAVLSEVRDCCVSGNRMSAWDGDEVLDQHFERALGPLNDSRELAFTVGLAGTLLGLIFQGFIAQGVLREGILSQAFLTGGLIAASTTLVGLGVAAYAGHLRASFADSFEALSSRIRVWLCSDVLPICDDKNQVVLDLGDRFKQITKDFEDAVSKLGESLGRSLRGAVSESGKRLRRNMKRLGDDVGEKLRNEVSVPFTTEMGRIQIVVESAAASLKQVSRDLRETSTRLSSELGMAVREPGLLSRELRLVSEEVSAAALRFEEVAAKAEAIVGTLAQISSQAELTLENLSKMESGRDGGGPGVAGPPLDDVRETITQLNAALNNTTPFLAELGRLLAKARGLR